MPDRIIMRRYIEAPGLIEFVVRPQDNNFEGEESPAVGSRLILTKSEWIRLGQPSKLAVNLTAEAD